MIKRKGIFIMTEKSMKNLVKVTGILNIIGAALVVLSTIVSMASLSQALNSTGSNSFEAGFNAANSGPAMFITGPVKIIIGFVGIATFVLAIILLRQNKRFNLSNAAAILTLIAGIFAWVIIFVSLVLWIIAAVFLLRMKIKEGEENSNEISSQE